MNFGDEDYLEAIKKEKQAYEIIEKIVKKHGDLLSIYWEIGDGQGDCVLYDLHKYMLCYGFISRNHIKTDMRNRIDEELGIPKKIEVDKKNKPVRKITSRLRLNIYERDGYKCKHCGTSNDLSLDHIHPVTKGGITSFNNLQTLCRPCNSRKGNRI
jgi:hypothetical protein